MNSSVNAQDLIVWIEIAAQACEEGPFWLLKRTAEAEWASPKRQRIELEPYWSEFQPFRSNFEPGAIDENLRQSGRLLLAFDGTTLNRDNIDRFTEFASRLKTIFQAQVSSSIPIMHDVRFAHQSFEMDGAVLSEFARFSDRIEFSVYSVEEDNDEASVDRS